MIRISFALLVLGACGDPQDVFCDPSDTTIEVVTLDTSGVVDGHACKPLPAECAGVPMRMDCDVAACRQAIEALCPAPTHADGCDDIDSPTSIRCAR